MRRRGAVDGLPVVVVDSGRTVGRVKEGVFDPDHARLTGFIVAAGPAELYLPFDQVHSVGATAITVGAEAVLLPVEVGLPAQVGSIPEGKRVVTREGELLGIVDDVIFDGESGAIWGYQVSGGFVSDFIDGKRNLPLTDELVIGPDAIVVADSERLRRPAGDGDTGLDRIGGAGAT
jgi:uncharacterized protein YrrD